MLWLHETQKKLSPNTNQRKELNLPLKEEKEPEPNYALAIISIQYKW